MAATDNDKDNGGAPPTPPTGPPDRKKKEYVYPGSPTITVELVNERLGGVFFGPMGEWLRSRYRKSVLQKDEFIEATSLLPEEIPGIQITVDVQNKRIIVVDPLSLPSNKQILDKISSAMRSANGNAPPSGYFTWQPKENCTNSEIKTWLFEIRKLLDAPTFQSKEWRDNPSKKRGGPMAEIMNGGKIPSRQEIEKMPGERETEFFSNSHAAILKRNKRKQAAEEAESAA